LAPNNNINDPAGSDCIKDRDVTFQKYYTKFRVYCQIWIAYTLANTFQYQRNRNKKKEKQKRKILHRQLKLHKI